MVTNELRERIARAMVSQREHFGGSDTQYAVSLGINGSVYNQIKNGKLERVLADNKWYNIAAKLGVKARPEEEWNTAQTETFLTITTQLEGCQAGHFSNVFCDDCGIGKTYAARYYARTHRNVVYVDCGQNDNEQELVRRIAKEFGVGHTGRLKDVYDGLVFYIHTLTDPLIILDEYGDLNQRAMMRVKKLTNATKEVCGFYKIGADGLREKIRRGIEYKKEGYAELYDRDGSRIQSVVPDGTEARRDFYRRQAVAVIKANAPKDADLKAILARSESHLRRVFIEIQKMKELRIDN